MNPILLKNTHINSAAHVWEPNANLNGDFLENDISIVRLNFASEEFCNSSNSDKNIVLISNYFDETIEDMDISINSDFKKRIFTFSQKSTQKEDKLARLIAQTT